MLWPEDKNKWLSEAISPGICQALLSITTRHGAVAKQRSVWEASLSVSFPVPFLPPPGLDGRETCEDGLTLALLLGDTGETLERRERPRRRMTQGLLILASEAQRWPCWKGLVCISQGPLGTFD